MVTKRKVTHGLFNLAGLIQELDIPHVEKKEDYLAGPISGSQVGQFRRCRAAVRGINHQIHLLKIENVM